MIVIPQNEESQFRGEAKALTPWIQDPTITDILINGTEQVYLERGGTLEPHPNPFQSENGLYEFIERLLLPIGKQIDAKNPFLDGKLLNGARFHLILPPIAPRGPFISIRKPARGKAVQLIDFCSPELATWLSTEITKGRNFLIGGATGAGKTTLLRLLLSQAQPTERIVVVEESTEIQIHHPHLVQLEARIPGPDGVGGVSLATLIRNALRMRPDRLVLGECRGPEAYDLLQVLNTGHLGSLSTIHANSVRGALRRLETLVMMACPSMPLVALREWVAVGIHVIVHLSRKEGRRQIEQVVSLSGVEGDLYRMTPIYPRGGQLS